MKKFLIFVTVVMLFSFSGRVWAQTAESFDTMMERLTKDSARKPSKDVFDNFLKSYWVFSMNESPESATYVGFPGQNARLSDNSLAKVRADKVRPAKVVTFLNKLKREKLNPDQVVTYDLVLDRAQLEVAATEFPDELVPLNQLDSSPQSNVQLLTAMPRETMQDMKDRLSRLKQLARVIKNDQERLTEGMKEGITVPFPAMQRVPGDLKKLTPKDVSQSPYFKEMSEWPKDVPIADRGPVEEEAKQVIEKEIYPSIKELVRYVEKDYLPKTRRTIGLSDLPNGRRWYDLAVKAQTTTDMTADQVHELGISEVARLAKALDEVQKELKFKGTRAQFLTYMKNSAKFRFKSEHDMMLQYRDAAKRIDAQLPRLFLKLPRQPYGVEPVPAYMAESNAGAFYQSAAMSAGKSGTFNINTREPQKQQWWEVETLTSHEAVPGHHFQIALAQEQDELPEIRKHADYTAYVEGWGLYAETLGYDIGLYKDPAMKFGQITNEMWRAVRLVVDTGMHSKNWSRQKAIDYMKSYIAKDEHEIVVEIDRYIVWPGQALAYKIGELKFQELKKRAKSELGDKFSLRAFHDRLLDGGALPLRVLEARMADWILSEKTKVAKP